MSPGPPYIPFNRVGFAGRELEYIQQAIANGHISGDGPFTRKCQAFLEQTVGYGRVLLTTSCTHALEMAALLLNLEPGDEVIVPSFTFVSTANAFALRGARLVFADIRPDTLNLDESLLPSLVTSHTRAIVPVHYAGTGCEMDTICGIGRDRGIPIIEDNAHGLFGEYRGGALGSFGAMATLSFHETKNISCGEGGALVLNEEAYIHRAEILREKGTNRSRFFRGEIDKYSWVDLGSSYVPSDLLAAFLLSQLESWRDIQSRRRAIWLRYAEALGNWAAAGDVRLPVIPEHCSSAWHMFHLICPSGSFRAALIERLKQAGILAVFHYLPLHLSEMGRRFGGRPGQCPVTEDLSERLLRLPFFTSLPESDQDRVIDVVTGFRG